MLIAKLTLFCADSLACHFERFSIFVLHCDWLVSFIAGQLLFNEPRRHVEMRSQTKLALFMPHRQGIQCDVQQTYPILQHFATKLCSSTNFKMLFLTVVKDFILPALFDL